MVVPQLDELESCAPCTAAGVRHGGGRRRLAARDAWEFRGVRPHQPGEPLSRVDWKSTAKTGSLMLREMEAAVEHDLAVLLGGTSTRRPGKADHDAFETAVCAAGSMAGHTLRSGHAATLLLDQHGWRPLSLTPDAAGRRRLLGALAEVKLGGPVRIGSSLSAITGGRGRARRRLLVLVVLELDQELVSALGRLRRQGASVSVVHVDYEQASRGAARPVDSPTPQDAAEHGADGDPIASSLAAAGVRYVRLGRDDNLRAALESRRTRRATAIR
jgi:uncharacterized protein (DUF58 family)